MFNSLDLPVHLLGRLDLLLKEETLSSGKISCRPGQEHLGQNVSARHNSTKERKANPYSDLDAWVYQPLSGKTSHIPCGISKSTQDGTREPLCLDMLRTQASTALDHPSFACQVWTCVCSHHTAVSSEQLGHGPWLWHRQLPSFTFLSPAM